MELWIPITIAAAFAQNTRSALQKHLKGTLSNAGASYTRFCYAVPFALLYLAALAVIGELPLPEPTPRFLCFVLLGAVTQVVATLLLLHLFSLRNFTVANAYSRTEAAQTAIFGAAILGDIPKLNAVIGIVVSLAGVIALSIEKKQFQLKTWLTAWLNPAAAIGLLSGACFGLASVSYRGASLALGGGEGNFLMPAAFTLAGGYVDPDCRTGVRDRCPGAADAGTGGAQLENRGMGRTGRHVSFCRLVYRDDATERGLRKNLGAGGTGIFVHDFGTAFQGTTYPDRSRLDRADRDRHPAVAALNVASQPASAAINYPAQRSTTQHSDQPSCELAVDAICHIHIMGCDALCSMRDNPIYLS